jgi:hypothetical protein
MSNALILAQLLLQYATKAQEIAQLFAVANAEGRDVTDAEVDASGVKADVALAKLQG